MRAISGHRETTRNDHLGCTSPSLGLLPRARATHAERQQRKSGEQLLEEANNRLDAAKKRMAQAQARAAKLRARIDVRDRKLRNRQAVVLGTWLQRPEYEAVHAEIIGKLIRRQDLEAFGPTAQGQA